MDAKTVYTIVKALDFNNQIEVYKMMKKDVGLILDNSGKQPLSNFSVADGVIYLIENHFNKIKKP